jgi:hypothetical protein
MTPQNIGSPHSKADALTPSASGFTNGPDRPSFAEGRMGFNVPRTVRRQCSRRCDGCRFGSLLINAIVGAGLDESGLFHSSAGHHAIRIAAARCGCPDRTRSDLPDALLARAAATAPISILLEERLPAADRTDRRRRTCGTFAILKRSTDAHTQPGNGYAATRRTTAAQQAITQAKGSQGRSQRAASRWTTLGIPAAPATVIIAAKR